jgi:lambda family phage minor tail protein L
MDKIQAQTNLKKLSTEVMNLYPSALVTFFEIDLSGVAAYVDFAGNPDKIFRFHNNVSLSSKDITFQGNIYYVCAIETVGFEVSSSGLAAKPILRMSVADESIPFFALFKNKIRSLGDIIGATVTRRRTFAKFLDSSNFDSLNKPKNPDPNDFIEFPKDVYFINKKSMENKLILEYELASIIELEGLMLPRRQIMSLRCNFPYRGWGCNYEYDENKVDSIHGESATLPNSAPPIATEDDKLIIDLINWGADVKQIGVSEEFKMGRSYKKGDSVYISKDGIKYHFVAKNNDVKTSPPDSYDWIADKCSKCIYGCKLRWSATNPIGSAKVENTIISKGDLPFGGFPGVERMKGRGYQ